jgi:hypothetical protein
VAQALSPANQLAWHDTLMPHRQPIQHFPIKSPIGNEVVHETAEAAVVFSLAVSQITGKHLTYAELTGKVGEIPPAN